MNGDFGLAKTFWLYGFIPNFILGKIESYFLFKHYWEVCLILFFIHIAYYFFVGIGIWRAAGKYKGRKIWAIFARISVILSFLSLIATVVLVVPKIISKIDTKHKIVWEKTFGGKYYDGANSIVQTKDGGYAVAGWTESFGNGYTDMWVVKLDRYGNKEWSKTFGGNNWEMACSIIQTKDGGYVVAGYTNSFGNGVGDMWILKLDNKGNKEWSKTFGGSDEDEAWSIIQTKDGGFVVAGWTESFGNGKSDMWIVKLDKNGKKIWSKTFGGSDEDEAYSIIQTKDGGYAVAGYTYSFGNGETDMWIVKLDRYGNKEWSKTFGGSDYDRAYSIIQTKDGGYAVAGYTKSFGNGGKDMWILKLDNKGNKEWSKTFGGSDEDEAKSIIQTKDGGYAVAGGTKSFGNGKSDMWIVKLDKNGKKIWSKTFGGSDYDEASSIVQTKDGGYAVAGYTYSFGNGKSDMWVLKLDSKGDLK